jgi:DNA-binding transcriptional LysR family regulator
MTTNVAGRDRLKRVCDEEQELLVDHLESIQSFVRVANFRSFSKAAEQFDQSRAAITRQIKDLESHLGTRLLNRNTRSVSLTEVGRLYLERVTPILDALEDMEQLVADQSAAPAGVLRILAPVVFAQRNLAPVLHSYLAKYPRVLPELMLSDNGFNLVAQGYDVGIVPAGSVRNATLVTRPLTGTSTTVCAARSYLASHGVPEHPVDLTNHATLISLPCHESGDALRFAGPEGEVSVPLRPVFLANDAEVLRQAALHGMGIGFLPSTLVQDDIRDGHLVSLLGDYRLPGCALQIAYASKRHLPTKVRTFIDHLVCCFGDKGSLRSTGDEAGRTSIIRSPRYPLSRTGPPNPAKRPEIMANTTTALTKDAACPATSSVPT